MFGDYQPEFRIHDSIWLGHRYDAAADANVCIKVITVADHEDRDVEPAKKLLLSAAVQQVIAEQSARWVPVLQLGSDGVDSFCVTQRFPRSLQTLLDTRFEVSPAELQTIMLEILEALVDLEFTFGLSHGNLKPSNVFLTSPYEIRGQCVRTGDPDGTADSLPVEEQASDVQSMGRILYSLVTFDPPNSAHYPLADLRPWKRLGSSARQWLDLCNQLLKTPARPGLARLSDLRTQISLIRTPRRRSFMAALFF